jgi:SAM-dependent methyltransferase
MKIINCYNCGSPDHTFYAEENGFVLVKCADCGLLFVENRPDENEISQASETGKHIGDKVFSAMHRFNPVKIGRYLTILEEVYQGDLSSKKKWLDVGCGYGELMIAVQKYSSGKVSVKGLEPNIHKQASARKRGLDVDYFDIGTHAVKYDVISLLNVYSHLPDPPKYLETVKRLLNPGGELILETGDTANFIAKDHYRPFLLPDHLSFASESILVGILKRLDFEILGIKKYPYVGSDLKSFGIELVKAFLPGYNSKLRYYLQIKKYSQTDIFIRAGLRN